MSSEHAGPTPRDCPECQRLHDDTDAARAGEGLDVERLLKIETAALAYRDQFRRIKGIPLAVDLGEAIDEERDALFAALHPDTKDPK